MRILALVPSLPRLVPVVTISFLDPAEIPDSRCCRYSSILVIARISPVLVVAAISPVLVVAAIAAVLVLTAVAAFLVTAAVAAIFTISIRFAYLTA